MTDTGHGRRWRADGKFLRGGPDRVWCRAATYGPFPGGLPEDPGADFQRIAAAGFNSVRLYQMPRPRLLDAAEDAGLKVFAGLEWASSADFLGKPALASAARVALVEGLRDIRSHPALAGVYIGNEVPADLVRWMGPARVREMLERLITLGRREAPDLLFAYASYPSTEYLEPENADFTAMNVYLEDPAAFRAYLKRLHHIAGDRPLVISEFGLDSRRNGPDSQARLLRAAMEAAEDEETAGFTVFAWSDRWWAGGEVTDWDFGLVDRGGAAKPALDACAGFVRPGPGGADPFFSVIVCTRNGRARIGACLDACRNLRGGGFEIIVVDDGSCDGTADHVAAHFPDVTLVRLPPSGLSAARNAGAEAARGEILAFTDDDCAPDIEWLARLRRVFQRGGFAAAGGPNLPPPPHTWQEAVVCAAPGAPSHVMLDDVEAEHLPGCNLAVRKAAFMDVGGFDPRFHTAGDDVDFCWRLRDAGHRLGFAPGAFVWHWRRPSIIGFLKQQLGYGRAERILLEKHPQRFSKNGGVIWQGFVYGGGPVRALADPVIYHGPMGIAGYQRLLSRHLPLRGLVSGHESFLPRLALALVHAIQPRLRAWARDRRLRLAVRPHTGNPPPPTGEFSIPGSGGTDRLHFLDLLLKDGWTPGDAIAEWDAEKQGTRVLLATERGPGGATLTLVRVWGDRSLLPF